MQDHRILLLRTVAGKGQEYRRLGRNRCLYIITDGDKLTGNRTCLSGGALETYVRRNTASPIILKGAHGDIKTSTRK